MMINKSRRYWKTHTLFSYKIKLKSTTRLIFLLVPLLSLGLLAIPFAFQQSKNNLCHVLALSGCDGGMWLVPFIMPPHWRLNVLPIWTQFCYFWIASRKPYADDVIYGHSAQTFRLHLSSSLFFFKQNIDWKEVYMQSWKIDYQTA